MDIATHPAFLMLVGFLAGAAAIWLVARGGAARSTRALLAAQTELATERGKSAQIVAQHEAEREQFKEERKFLKDEVRATIGAAASDALSRSNEHLLRTANEAFGKERAFMLDGVKDLVSPVGAELARVRLSMGELDKQRLAQNEVLKTSIDGLASVGSEMRSALSEAHKETAVIASVLKDNRVRGKWGEMSLERTIEAAGMYEHVSYARQTSQGAGIPDVTIHLPGRRHVPIDVKTPLEAYYAAMETTDADAQRALLEESARALRTRVKEVYDRGYHRTEGACDYCVLYVPIESVMSAAFAADPALHEYAISKQVMIASPLTLMPMLRAFAAAWTLERERDNANEIVEHAKTLVERLLVVGDHLAVTGKSLEKTVDAFNKSVGSFEGRVVPEAQRVHALAGRTDDVAERSPKLVEKCVRLPQRLAELPGVRASMLGDGRTA